METQFAQVEEIRTGAKTGRVGEKAQNSIIHDGGVHGEGRIFVETKRKASHLKGACPDLKMCVGNLTTVKCRNSGLS